MLTDADVLARMSPQERMRYASGGALADESTALEDQIAQARALKGHSLASQHSSPIGAAFGSLADILNAGRANNLEHQALERQGDIRGEQTGLRADFMGRLGDAQGSAQQDAMAQQMALIEALRAKQQQAQPQQPQQPAQGNSFLSGLGFGE